MKRPATTAVIALLAIFTPGELAAQQSEQIRVEDFCPTISKRLKGQLANSLYKKALERKKQGRLLPMSRQRLEYVEHLRAAFREETVGPCHEFEPRVWRLAERGLQDLFTV